MHSLYIFDPKVAVKIIETDKIKEDYVRKNLLREAQLMRRLRHPNIIRLYETMKTNNLYCLVTEIAEGGELLSHVRSDFKEKRLSEATTRPFIRQLVSALFHLHSVGIVHRYVLLCCTCKRGLCLTVQFTIHPAAPYWQRIQLSSHRCIPLPHLHVNPCGSEL